MGLDLHHFFRHRAAWCTLGMGLAATAAVGWQMHREAVAMDRQRLAMRAAEIQSQLDARIEKSEMLLENLRDYLTHSGEQREPVFQRWCYVNGLTLNCPWLLGIAVATNRNALPWPAHLPKATDPWTEADTVELKQVANEHRIECHLGLRSELQNGTQFLADYDLRATYVNPTEGGFTFSSHPFAVAVRTGSLGMSRRGVVMRGPEDSEIIGTTMYLPCFQPELADFIASPTPSRNYRDSSVRWLLCSGVIVAPVDFNVLEQSLWDGANADVGVEIFCSTNPAAVTWLNNVGPGPHAADPRFEAYLTHRLVWPMYRQKYLLFFYTTPLFEAQSPRRLAKLAMIAGTILTLLATALVGVVQRARQRQERMTDQIREARDALAAAQREREKFSRDLHDGTIQSLYAIQLGLGHTAEKIEGNPAQARREFALVRRELDAVIAEIRQFITAESGPNGRVDFSSVLEALVERVRNGTKALVTLHCDPTASRQLTGDQGVQLANITREALSNSLRHANPQHVDIRLSSDRHFLILEIADDGTGFDPASPGRSGVGLTSMTARTGEIGGTLDIQSAPGQGTRVVIRVPADRTGSGEADFPEDSTDPT